MTPKTLTSFTFGVSLKLVMLLKRSWAEI